jgi:dihydroneopterin aldolase
MFRVFLEGIELNGKHGVTDEERLIGHRFLIGINLLVEGNADFTDELADTVDYSKIASLAEQVNDSKSFRTVEALGGAIANIVLASDERIAEVLVRVAKVHPPVDMVIKAAGVEVVRKRE